MLQTRRLSRPSRWPAWCSTSPCRWSPCSLRASPPTTTSKMPAWPRPSAGVFVFLFVWENNFVPISCLIWPVYVQTTTKVSQSLILYMCVCVCVCVCVSVCVCPFINNVAESMFRPKKKIMFLLEQKAFAVTLFLMIFFVSLFGQLTERSVWVTEFTVCHRSDCACVAIALTCLHHVYWDGNEPDPIWHFLFNSFCVPQDDRLVVLAPC